MLTLFPWILPVVQVEKPGLLFEAQDAERRLVQAVPAPNFALGENESLHPRLSPAFRATWRGFLKIARPGRYVFSGQARVRVAGRDAAEGPIELGPGLHELRVEFVREPGRPARLLLEWESDHFRREPVPSSAFVRFEDPPEDEILAERGRDWAGELGCVNCHRADPAGFALRRGPDLSHVGSRTNVRWLARWLEDPRAFRPSTAMPALLSRQEAADVAAFLAELGDPRPAPPMPPPDPARAVRGRELFEKIGCAQCHAGAGGVSLEGLGSKYEPGALRVYLMDPLKVNPAGRMPSLFLNAEEAALLAEHLTASRSLTFEAAPPAGDAARGRGLVETRGCLSCHPLGGAENRSRAPDLALLVEGRGCLAPEPPAGLPRYDLGAERRRALGAFLNSFKRSPDRSAAPVHAFHQIVRAYRCAACHAIHDSTPTGLEAYPPPLTDAGLKLRPAWIEAVLLGGKRIRPWMELRMPHFGEGVRRIAAALPAAAGAGPEDPPRIPTPAEVREGVRQIGRGRGGLSCITCHDFKGHASLGTRGPDMVEMYARLREEWFRRWMRDPIRIQPGTSMPNFFASVPEAEAERAIDLLWACLAAGRDIPLPEGLETAHTHLVGVHETPVVLRTYLPEASPAAIAVGLPGGISYCFDADECRLRYAWRGDFLDMTPAWSGRGGLPAIPAGKRFYTAPDGFPLRFGGRPPGRPRFRGYALVQGHPEFRYEVDGIEIRQRVSVLASGFLISFELSPTPQRVEFRIGRPAGVRITPLEGTVEGEWLRLGAAAAFSLKIEREEK